MSSLPSGTVTFLFTDIEGSTKLAQEHPDRWESLRERHHSILRGAIEANHGYIFQIIGDAFCVAFHTVVDGLNAAVLAQRGLQREEWGESSIKVRMGLHTGSAELHGNDYRGYLTMAKVQRIMSVADGGQVLLSNISAELLHSELPSGVTLRDLKEHRLKGLPEPERLWQMVAPDLQQNFPPLRSLKEKPNNLPVQFTSFIGREKEVEQIKKRLEKTRLVTLTGSGGIGKTRLSVQVASQLLDEYPNGVWLVELAPVTDRALVTQAVCTALDITPQGKTTTLNVLTEYLHSKKILLVLDNCEHLIDSCAQLCETLLHACHNVRILASSREALGIEGESPYRIPSLSLADSNSGLKIIEQSEAVQLFVERAKTILPGYTLTEINAPTIAQICQRMDGIALAIELAASRVKILKVEQIKARLDDAFRLLTGGSRTALPRQQTLRGTIDWSYNLLSEEEKLVLRSLSVFVGGWTLDAAESICDSAYMLDLLTRLVDKSLVAVDREHIHEPRYYLLETIRQYGHEKLIEAGDSEIIQDRHLAYFVKMAEQAEPELYRSNQVFWLNKLDNELDNLRRALEWALATNLKLGLQLIINSAVFWEGRGDIQEVQQWLAQFLEQYTLADSLRARALVFYGFSLATGANHSQAQIIANQSLELSRAVSDKQAEAFSLWGLGAVMALSGNIGEGIPIVQQSLALYRSLEDKRGQAHAMGWLGLNSSDWERSRYFLLESLKLHRELGNISGIAFCLNQLILNAIWGGDFSSPVQWLEEAMLIHRQLGRRRGEVDILQFYGLLYYWQGDYQQACSYFEDSITLGKKIGISELDWQHVHMAYARLRQGNVAQARELFEFCILRFQKGNNTIGLVYTIEGLASLHMNQQQAEQAARILAWADTMRERIGDHRPPVEQALVERDLAIIQSKLDNLEFAKLTDEGKAMTTEEAIAYALETSTNL